jgi:hypothetical protein
MIAQDPLSLVFLACFLLSGGFLVVSTLLGGQHHAGHIHLGGHDLHLGSHVHLGHGAHAGPIHAGHVAHGSHAGAGNAQASSGTNGSGPSPASLQSVADALQSGLNLYSILLFLLVFGLVGYLLHNLTQVGVVLSIVLPAILGAAVGLALGNAIFRLFLPGAESELGPESSRLEGRLGTVSMAIHEGGIGEVIFTRPGVGRQSLGARSSDGQAIAAESEIVILGYRDGIATVQTWDRFMAEVRSGHEPLLEPIDHQG